MDTLEAIRIRRSIRRYTGDVDPKKDLEIIVDAGRLAPTGNNRQPWDFMVVTDRATTKQFKVSYAWIEQAGAVIIVVMDPASRWWVEDGAADDRESAPCEYGLGLRVVLGRGGCLTTRRAIQNPLGGAKRKAGDGIGSNWDSSGNTNAKEETFRGSTPLGEVLTRFSKGLG